MDEALIKRILPHSDDAERAVIGSMLMDTDAVVTASEMITGDDFYQRKYGILFDAMVDMNNKNIPVDLITLQEELKTRDVPEELASVEFLSDLLNSISTSVNIKQYAKLVADKSALRRMIKANEEIANTRSRVIRSRWKPSWKQRKSAFSICSREKVRMILCRSRRLF